MAKPFTKLNAALDALDARDLCGDLALCAEDAPAADAEKLESAADALRTAESVETLADFAANLREALELIQGLPEVASVASKLTRLLTRC